MWSDGSNDPYYVFDGSDFETGSYEITLIASDPNGCADSDSVMIHVVPSTGTASSEDNLSIHMYPNPAKGILYVDLSRWQGDDVLIRIYNQSGFECKLFKFTSFPPGDPLYLDVSELHPGIYYIQILTDVDSYHGIFVIL